ncbi:MAG: tRNA 4-thiouridine(8) synthase ThiI [Deltaproteobacteria bacterium]|nr:tRNA 4-thiouridine(8) synthase ThiI [Deltaproteobacteria bacterium]MBN2688929.1 tRNA 4-thiouridine(8) synthase ThiI [Deltaproteobacteria bacterium]
MKVKAIGLLSGGLDGILAVKVVQDQDIHVEGVTFETPFFSAEKAREAARHINLPLSVMNITEEYLIMLRAPRYGYGKNMNPCIDCHSMMLRMAGRRMEETGADFIFTGEVLGQRPMSQTKQSLHVVAKNSGYEGHVLRPLSARLLGATVPEREGKVDRNRLLDIQGRSRKRQLAMAQHYGITAYSTPAGGCLLTDSMFSKRLKDLFNHHGDEAVRDIELLKHGRHLRLNEEVKIVVGRHKGDNLAIYGLSLKQDVIIKMKDYPGPIVLIPYGCCDDVLETAASICAAYSDAPGDREVTAACHHPDGSIRLVPVMAARKEDLQPLVI